jgi:hypothetical protein
MRRLLAVALLAALIVAAVGVTVAQTRRNAGTLWIGVVHLDGERVSTGGQPLPVITFRTYQAQGTTSLYFLSGSVSDAFIGPPVGCAAFAQVLYTVVVSENDPGPGPWADRTAFFAALNPGYKRVANIIQKLTTQVGQLSSETTGIFVNLASAPVSVPNGWYLTLVSDFTNSGVGACQVLGTYDFESQLMASTSAQMNRVR